MGPTEQETEQHKQQREQQQQRDSHASDMAPGVGEGVGKGLGSLVEGIKGVLGVGEEGGEEREQQQHKGGVEAPVVPYTSTAEILAARERGEDV